MVPDRIAGLAGGLAATYDAVTEAVRGLEESRFALPTRTSAWTVQQLLFHQLLDAQRALAALACTTEADPDVDAVSYWRPFRPSEGDGGVAHARFVVASAAAFAGPAALVDWWRVFAEATPRAARAADPATRVSTQGHVLSVVDLLSTLLVEATIHYLDLTVELPQAPPPLPAGLSETRSVLESLGGIAGVALPSRWDDVEAALKATGRVPLTDADHADLGDRATAVPLLG